MFLCRAKRILGLCYIIVKVCLNFLFPFVAFYTTKSSPFFVLVLQEQRQIMCEYIYQCCRYLFSWSLKLEFFLWSVAGGWTFVLWQVTLSLCCRIIQLTSSRLTSGSCYVKVIFSFQPLFGSTLKSRQEGFHSAPGMKYNSIINVVWKIFQINPRLSYIYPISILLYPIQPLIFLGTSLFLHWLVGMVFVFYFASFVLLLREVRRLMLFVEIT